jgi:hypothetical protein
LGSARQISVAFADAKRYGVAMTTAIDQIISHRKTRTTGATVTITRVGPGSSFEQDPGWMTMCLNHGQLVFHETRALAFENAPVPEQWCSDCELLVTLGEPKISGRKIN